MVSVGRLRIRTLPGEAGEKGRISDAEGGRERIESGMHRLGYDDFQREQESFGEALLRSEGIARFCSHLPWQCAAFEHLFGYDMGIPATRQPLIVEHEGNWIAFAERNHRVFFPLESAWMFGCPLVGHPAEAVDLLRRVAGDFQGGGCGFVVSGVREESKLHRELLKMRVSARKFEEFETTDSMTIDLSGGVEAYLARRSRSFRKGIRQMREPESLEIEDASAEEPDAVFSRIFDIQCRSYKSREGGNIFSDARYLDFYRDLYERLWQTKQIRILFARIEGGDAAYILGGVWSNIYRGFQMSYDDAHRSLALGNRLQLENLRRMEAEGITHYDLGMHSTYKERWADRRERYRGVFVVL